MLKCFLPIFDSLKASSFCAVAAVAVAISFSSCINEDTSDCGCDQDITYDMSLRTNVDTEISSQLQTQVEQNFAPQLRKALENVFTDYAKSNDLSFYIGGVRMRHEQNEMNSTSAKYTLYLDRNTYDHLALANVAEEAEVDVLHGDTLSSMVLQLEKKDTIDNHGYGLFTARKRILSTDFDSTTIDVPLYMQNCAAVVLVDQSEVKADELFGYVDGMTTTFHVQDSLYTTDRQVVTRANLVLPADGTTTKAEDATTAESAIANSGMAALYAVTFPSTTDEWQFNVIAKVEGKYTKSTLTVHESLDAGKLKILKVKLKADGSLATTTANVGVSVKIDWKPGGDHNVDI